MLTLRTATARPDAATEAMWPARREMKTQGLLDHARGEATGIYLREELEVSRQQARLRTEKRKP
jgi:hypothetical protein